MKINNQVNNNEMNKNGLNISNYTIKPNELMKQPEPGYLMIIMQT